MNDQQTPKTEDAMPTLEPSDLQPADVLLSRGEGVISDLIAKFDGGSYSHSALWSGASIIQATSAGITSTAFAGQHGVFRRRDLSPEGAREIVDLAKLEVSGRYAYGELVLLGLLFMPGIRVRGAWASRLLDAIGGPTALNLKKWLNQNSGKKVRVCSELVASSFYRAEGQKLALQVLATADRPAPASDDVAEAPPSAQGSDDADVPRARSGAMDHDLEALAQTCTELLSPTFPVAMSVRPGEDRKRRIFTGTIAITPNGESVGVVTPADLQFSPSLRFVGTVRS